MFPDSFFPLMVTVCNADSLFLKYTFSPAFAVSLFGLNASPSWSTSGAPAGIARLWSRSH